MVNRLDYSKILLDFVRLCLDSLFRLFQFHGGKITFVFIVIELKFNFPDIGQNTFLAGFLEKLVFRIVNLADLYQKCPHKIVWHPGK